LTDEIRVALTVEDVVFWILGGVLFPLWLVAGVADWLAHRQTKIETTSGLRESISHLVLASLSGTGVLILLLLEVNAAVLLILAVLFVAHETVTQLDLRSAVPVRTITTIEQHVHAYLTAVPFAVIVAVAIVVLSSGKTDLALSLKAAPVSLTRVALMLGAMTLFGAIPFWEEFWRCLRVHQRRAELGRVN
jgi:hypothetical protein